MFFYFRVLCVLLFNSCYGRALIYVAKRSGTVKEFKFKIEGGIDVSYTVVEY